jgi:hypothetical protein
MIFEILTENIKESISPTMAQALQKRNGNIIFWRVMSSKSKDREKARRKKDAKSFSPLQG